ncbi:MAG: 3-phosphoserine/phosphohydroxythreonine transaminase [Phycisphaerales bacterium JB039]
MTTAMKEMASGLLKAERSTYNFAAGPAILPEAVLKQAQHDIWDIDGTGIGVMEHSHRGPVIDRIFQEAQADCRKLAGIGENYRILFMMGGASSQFFTLPANLLPDGATADYINTGAWSQKAIKEAKRYGKVHVAATSEPDNFTWIPGPAETKYSDKPVYLHFTSNNTIFGTEFRSEPACPKGAFLVCDTSSDMFSRPIDVSKYGLIYAGAQKNLGPAGVTLVIIREDLLKAVRDLPPMLQYATHAENDSRYNTPPVFAIYLVGQVFKWILGQGGLAKMAEHNLRKAKPIYDVLDSSSFFRGTARADSRSLMNITFRAPSEDLEKKFITEAKKQGFDGLKGHRSVGGMRASVYNAFPEAGAKALAEFMREFERTNG